ncbi:MAG: hypothetical protein ACP5E4_02975, partial [Candidatus Aenigmatarchaeota archaeon]
CRYDITETRWTDTGNTKPANDTQVPVVDNLQFTISADKDYFNVTASAEDNCSNITSAEYFLGLDTCGGAGNGTEMAAADGAFDEKIEEIIAADIENTYEAPIKFCVQAKDSSDNWGNCACITLTFEDDSNPPYISGTPELNEVANPKELLVCGTNPVLTATICDAQTEIQAGEYFLNLFVPLSEVPEPYTGYYMELTDKWTPSGEYCASLEAEIDLSLLEEGTHYINQIRGFDGGENWVDISTQNLNYSFVKDTLAPVTIMNISPYGGESFECECTGAKCQNFTGECYYVHNGTNVTLTASDQDLQGTGEFAGGVRIHYRLLVLDEDGITWYEAEQGLSDAGQPVELTLRNETYHLEYWAEDLCGWQEERQHKVFMAGEILPLHQFYGYIYKNGVRVTAQTDVTVMFGSQTLNATKLDKGEYDYRLYIADEEGVLNGTLSFYALGKKGAEHNFTAGEATRLDLQIVIPGYCGDGVCNNGETCSSCPEDCGACFTGGGGGSSSRTTRITTLATNETNETEEEGGGGDIITTTNETVLGNCTPKWFCGDWKKCENETQTRNCIDLNKCGTDLDKPELARECTIEILGNETNVSTCGDGVCNIGENCESCLSDCGECRSLVERFKEPFSGITGRFTNVSRTSLYWGSLIVLLAILAYILYKGGYFAGKKK